MSDRTRYYELYLTVNKFEKKCSWYQTLHVVFVDCNAKYVLRLS